MLGDRMSLSLSLSLSSSPMWKKPGKPQRNPRRKEGKRRKTDQKPKMNYQKLENELPETRK